MSTLFYANQYFSTTLNVGGGINDTQTTGIVLQSISGIHDITKPGIACLSYTDPLNTSTAEWVTYNSISGVTNELQGVTRGAEGFSAKTHANGAVITFPVSKSHFNNLNDAILNTLNGWTLSALTFTRTGNLTMTTPSDITAYIVKGTCFKITDTTTKYFYAESAVYSAGVTTITFMTTTTNTLAGSPTVVYYSNVTPADMPVLAYTPTSDITIGNGTLSADYYVSGKYLDFKISFIFGSTSSIPNDPKINYPTTIANYVGTASTQIIGTTMFYDTGVTPYNGFAVFFSTSQFAIRAINTASTYASRTTVSSTVPFTFATGDEIYIIGRVQI